MSSLNLFRWMVRYHIDVNLGKCLPDMVNNRLVDEKGRPLKEGYDTRTPHQGFLIVANGDTLAGRLRKDEVILDDHIEFVKVPGLNEFFDYLSANEDSDGAYVFDGINTSITRVGELNNNPPSIPRGLSVYDYVPSDFVSYAHDVGVKNKLGTKTRLAIKLPHAYGNTETYQIKRSSYGNTGMGQVTYFGPEGLKEQFFFMAPDKNPKYYRANSPNELYGVHRKYTRDGNKVIPVLEEIVSLK